MKKQLAVLALLSLFSTQMMAQNPSTQEYITEGGFGVLSIKKHDNKPNTFELNALGSNGHGCFLEGTINKSVSILSEIPGEICTVKFKDTINGIEVIPEGDSCRMLYCGMRASFESEHLGEYKKVTPNCFIDQIAKDRKEALALYKNKKFDESLAKLEPVLKSCSKTLYWIDKAWIQNDLAVAYAKLRQHDKCGAVLAELKEDADLTEEEIKENYPPLEAELYWPIVKATKTNLKLCKIK